MIHFCLFERALLFHSVAYHGSECVSVSDRVKSSATLYDDAGTEGENGLTFSQRQ